MRIPLTSLTLALLPLGATSGQLPTVRSLVNAPAVAPPDTFGTIVGFRALSDGRVLIDDGKNRLVVLFDVTLTRKTVVLGPTFPSDTLAYPSAPMALLPLGGDRTLFTDASGRAPLVFDAMGQVTSRPVGAEGKAALRTGGRGSDPMIDRLGRLIFSTPSGRGGRGGPPPAGKDTSPPTREVIRVDLETGALEVLGVVRTTPGIPLSATLVGRGPVPAGAPPVRMQTVLPAFQVGDDWTMTSEGMLAIIRARDYHVDWIGPTGPVRSTPPVGWPWVVLGAQDKARLADSIQAVFDTIDARAQATKGTAHPSAPLIPVTDQNIVSRTMPDTVPPFVPHTARGDLEGRVWEREGMTTYAGPSGPPIYDVIAPDGQVVDRVRLPTGWSVLGFGPGGALYLSRNVDGGYTFERITLPPR